MAGIAGTARVKNMRSGRTGSAGRNSAAAGTGRQRANGSVRTSRNLFLMFAGLVLAVFILVGLSAYAASLQHANNVLEQENKNLEAEIFSLNSQIVEETKVTKVEKIATEKYGMVYPTSDNCIVISEKEDGSENLAAVIRSEAYN